MAHRPAGQALRALAGLGPEHAESALLTLYVSPLGEHLVFKGGTSLSKAYSVIRRFSEDVDLTHDIRTLVPDLVGDNGDAVWTMKPGSL